MKAGRLRIFRWGIAWEGRALIYRWDHERTHYQRIHRYSGEIWLVGRRWTARVR